MKQLTMNLMAAAVVVVAAGNASAQNLKAEIPFTFQAAGVMMTPGTYQILHASNLASRHVVLRNTETHQSVLAMYTPTDPAKELKAQGRAGIQFECAASRCALREIWTDNGGPALGFNTPKPGSDGARMAFIPLTSTKADCLPPRHGAREAVDQAHLPR
jgi:hypothetical protein